MVLEVLKGSTYIIFIAKDENEKVIAVYPIRAYEVVKNKEKVKEEIKEFFRELGEMPKRINFSQKVVNIARRIITESLNELKKEIEEEEKKAKQELESKIRKIKKVGEGKGAHVKINLGRQKSR